MNAWFELKMIPRILKILGISLCKSLHIKTSLIFWLLFNLERVYLIVRQSLEGRVKWSTAEYDNDGDDSSWKSTGHNAVEKILVNVWSPMSSLFIFDSFQSKLSSDFAIFNLSVFFFSYCWDGSGWKYNSCFCPFHFWICYSHDDRNQGRY